MTEYIRCPICGSETFIRIAKKGQNAGRMFHVCSRYPDCKGKVPIEKQNKEAKMAAKRDVRGLVKALRHKDEVIRSKATEALVKIGEVEIGALIQELAKPVQTHVGQGIEVSWPISVPLSIIGQPAILALIKALKCRNYTDHRELSKREGAAITLGMIGDEKAVEPLIACLEYGPLSPGAIIALGEIGDVRAVEPLLKKLILPIPDEAEGPMQEIIQALGHIGDERAVETLIRILLDRSGSNYLFPVECRELAAAALADVGDKMAVDPLIEALSDEIDFIRRSAARCLGRIGDERAVEPLIKALSDKKNQKKMYGLSDKPDRVRDEVAQALEKIGTNRALKALERFRR